MDDQAPLFRYDAAMGTLSIRLAGGEEVRVGGLGADLPCWRVGAGAASEAALWLSPEQAEVLAKMIDYVLARVKVSAASRQALEQLAPRVAQLHDDLAATAERPTAYLDVTLDSD